MQLTQWCRMVLLHAALDHFGHGEGRHVVGILAGAETGVKAQLLGQLMGDAGTAAAYDELVAQALGLQQLDEVGQVLDVYILLGCAALVPAGEMLASPPGAATLQPGP